MQKATENRFREYKAKPKRTQARELLQNEVVRCYNGKRIGQKGDFVVVDEFDRVMVIRRDRFLKNFTEVKDAGNGSVQA